MMNKKNWAMTTVLGAISLLAIACAKTSNSGPSASSPATASNCTTGSDGVSRDQYGRTCSNYAVNNNSCVNTRWNASTGQYLSLTTGQPVSCQSTGYTDGFNSLPVNGMINGQQFSGCGNWTAQSGQQYVPVDVGNGQLVCMNVNYLQQNNPGYNWNQYAIQQQPIYTCSGADCGGYSQGYASEGYGCSASINFGVNFGGLFSAGVGACLPGL